MSEPKSYTALRSARLRDAFLVVDPGGNTGLAYGYEDGHIISWSALLADLPYELSCACSCGVAFIVCESYSLLGGNRRNDPSMPAAQGIGMARQACQEHDVELFMVPPGAKRAGHQALDARGRDAYAAASNDHRRDAVDIAGLIYRTLKEKP